MEFKTISCKCSECKSMCKTLPCLGTPHDIEKLIAAGYGDRLEKEYFPIFGEGDIVDERIPFIKPKSITGQWDGQCVFHTAEGLCELHLQLIVLNSIISISKTFRYFPSTEGTNY